MKSIILIPKQKLFQNCHSSPDWYDDAHIVRWQNIHIIRSYERGKKQTKHFTRVHVDK